jgi:hypothetical protein
LRLNIRLSEWASAEHDYQACDENSGEAASAGNPR